MPLAETLQQDMKSALRAGAKLELGALRLLLAAIRRQEIDTGRALSDADTIALIQKLIKQGREAQAQFQAAGRDELAAKEAAEIDVFGRYLPGALSADEVEALIRRAIASTGAASVRDMGQVMAVVKSEAAGRVDMAAVSARVREILAEA